MRRRKFWRVLMCEKGVFAWDFVSLFNKLLWSKSVLRSQQTNGKPIERGLCFLPQGQSLSSGELQQQWKYVINHVWNSKNAWFHWKKKDRCHWLGTWLTALAIDQCFENAWFHWKKKDRCHCMVTWNLIYNSCNWSMLDL